MNNNVTKEQMNALPKIAAIDFDGVIVKDKYPAIGPVYPQMVDFCKHLKARGAKLILWTSRDGQYLQEAVDFCNKQGIVFDAINDNIPEVLELFDNNSRKVYANAYIDDKAINPNQILDIWDYENEDAPHFIV